MKILLIRYHPESIINAAKLKPIISVEGITPPLGIAYVAAVLELAGYDVKILDCQALNLSMDEIRREIETYGPDVVGITSMTPILLGVLEVAKLTKDIDKKISVVIGGPHVSLFPETVGASFIDFGVRGEGEYTFLELVKNLEKGGDFKKINGLVWKKKGKIIINMQREPIKNLDDIPFPARHLLPTKKYDVIIMKHPMTTMVASRGCPFNCAFCFKEAHYRVFRIRNAQKVVDEMEECIDKLKVKEISFYDDCWPNKQFLTDICNEIIRRGIDIAWETPQRVNLVDQDLLKLMKRAGCVRLRYGVESGSQRILNMMRKNVTIEQIKNAFEWTKDAGIETFAFFMVAYPTETYDDFIATINLAKEIDADWALFGATIPYPGTDLWLTAVNDFGFNRNYWHEWSLGIRNDQIPYFLDNAEELCKKAYQEFYMRKKFVLKKIMKIRGMHDLQKYWKGYCAIRQFKI